MSRFTLLALCLLLLIASVESLRWARNRGRINSNINRPIQRGKGRLGNGRGSDSSESSEEDGTVLGSLVNKFRKGHRTGGSSSRSSIESSSESSSGSFSGRKHHRNRNKVKPCLLKNGTETLLSQTCENSTCGTTAQNYRNYELYTCDDKNLTRATIKILVIKRSLRYPCRQVNDEGALVFSKVCPQQLQCNTTKSVNNTRAGTVDNYCGTYGPRFRNDKSSESNEDNKSRFQKIKRNFLVRPCLLKNGTETLLSQTCKNSTCGTTAQNYRNYQLYTCDDKNATRLTFHLLGRLRSVRYPCRQEDASGSVVFSKVCPAPLMCNLSISFNNSRQGTTDNYCGNNSPPRYNGGFRRPSVPNRRVTNFFRSVNSRRRNFNQRTGRNGAFARKIDFKLNSRRSPFKRGGKRVLG